MENNRQIVKYEPDQTLPSMEWMAQKMISGYRFYKSGSKTYRVFVGVYNPSSFTLDLIESVLKQPTSKPNSNPPSNGAIATEPK